MRHGLVLLSLVVGVVTPTHAQMPADTFPQVNATGEAEVVLVPDLLTVYFDMVGYGVTVAEAAADLQAKEDSVRAAVSSAYPHVTPLVPWGYRATRNPQAPRNYSPGGGTVQTNLDQMAVAGFQVTLSELDELGGLIRTLVENGARQISGVHYAHSALDEIRRELTVVAVKNAEMQAEALASGLGGELGPSVRIGLARGYDPYQNQIQQLIGYQGQSPSPSPRDIKIRVRVDGTWRLIR